MLLTATGHEAIMATPELVRVLMAGDPVLLNHGLTIVCQKCGGTPRPEYEGSNTIPCKLHCGCRTWVIRA
jgi:hypothetical protein